MADLPGRRLAVELRLGADGRLEVVLPRPDVNRGLCITNSLGVFMPGAEVAIRETMQTPATPAGVGGGEGALFAGMNATARRTPTARYARVLRAS